jgi:hypothetical protein
MLTIPDDIKTEWTAEDNVMMSRIVGYLKQDSNEFPERSKRIGEMIEWFKNLCGKHTWKPGKEQVKCLAIALARLKENGDIMLRPDISMIESLYDDLVKMQ